MARITLQRLPLLRALARDRRGAVAVIFSLTLIPLVAFAGAAMDYSRASRALVALQQAADSTALLLSKKAATSTAAQLNTSATSTVAGLFNVSEATLGTVAATYSTTGGTTLSVSAQASVQTSFMKLVGLNTITVSTSSLVSWGSSRLRVALVLDNTGSMNDSGKLDALKTASTNLLSQLQSNAKNAEDVYVSIIPFSKDVNVGTSNVNANWIRWDIYNASYGIWYYILGNSIRNSWTGCVTDRDQNYDTTATAPTANATYFPAENYDDCPVSLMGLSNNWTALNAKITSMTGQGSTNQTIGLQWGFQSLVGTSPLTVPAMDSNYTYKQIIVLLTDGLNTQNRWDGNGSSPSAAVDARTLAACTAAKNAGVIVYAFQVNTGGDPTSTMLQQCASDSSKTAVLTSGAQIVSKFNDVAGDLLALRITR